MLLRDTAGKASPSLKTIMARFFCAFDLKEESPADNCRFSWWAETKLERGMDSESKWQAALKMDSSPGVSGRAGDGLKDSSFFTEWIWWGMIEAMRS